VSDAVTPDGFTPAALLPEADALARLEALRA